MQFFYKGILLPFSSGQKTNKQKTKTEKLRHFKLSPVYNLQVNSGSGIGFAGFESQFHHTLLGK